jgi:hypothetical protein
MPEDAELDAAANVDVEPGSKYGTGLGVPGAITSPGDSGNGRGPEGVFGYAAEVQRGELVDTVAVTPRNTHVTLAPSIGTQRPISVRPGWNVVGGWTVACEGVGTSLFCGPRGTVAGTERRLS